METEEKILESIRKETDSMDENERSDFVGLLLLLMDSGIKEVGKAIEKAKEILEEDKKTTNPIEYQSEDELQKAIELEYQQLTENPEYAGNTAKDACIRNLYKKHKLDLKQAIAICIKLQESGKIWDKEAIEAEIKKTKKQKK